MSKSNSFFLKNKTILLFLFLEFFSFAFIINSHSFHHSKFLNSTNGISGFILKKSNAISNYFYLNKQNKTLIEENTFLINSLSSANKKNLNSTSISIDSVSKYKFIPARVISNPYSKRNNILTLDKGKAQGIQPDMGVVLPNGVIGITLNVSENYTTVLSLLNSQSKINAKIKKSHHYGSLHWDGKDITKVLLDDLPIQAHIQKGDTIISGGKSVFFPEGIPIGTISNIDIDNKAYASISVDLFTDMSSLFNVYVVKNTKKKEQLDLETKSINE